jgi:hypothetical protein
LARQDADVAVLERPLRPQGDLDALFAEFERTLDVGGGDMDNTKPDFRDGPSGLTEGSSGSQISRSELSRATWSTENPEPRGFGVFAFPWACTALLAAILDFRFFGPALSVWPRAAPCATPQALIKGTPGVRLELGVTFEAGRKHLPVVTLRRVA